MSYAPDATAYTAPRNASVPLAQKFSTRVTGMLLSLKLMDRGRALPPTLMDGKQVPSQAAWISSLPIPAS